jgi:hypothetical protein
VAEMGERKLQAITDRRVVFYEQDTRHGSESRTRRSAPGAASRRCDTPVTERDLIVTGQGENGDHAAVAWPP